MNCGEFIIFVLCILTTILLIFACPTRKQQEKKTDFTIDKQQHNSKDEDCTTTNGYAANTRLSTLAG